MAFLPFAEWLPDQPDFNNPGSALILNVVPRTEQSYTPFPSMAVSTGALGSTCLGAVGTRDLSQNIYNFAGTSSKLYQLSSTLTWADVSKVAGYSVPAGGQWSFTQFNNYLLAANIGDTVQKFLLGTDSVFSDLAAAAPKAKYMATSKDFLLLANTTGGTADPTSPGDTPQRVWWPKIGDPTTWPTLGTATAVSAQSDAQDVVGDQGVITGIVGNNGPSDATVYFERAVFQMMYIGSPDIWGFYPRLGVRGCVCPGSIRKTEVGTIYLGEDDFYLDSGVGYPVGIGNMKIARTFYSDINRNNLSKCCSILDPFNKLYYFCYPSFSSGSGAIDTILVCNYALKSMTGTPGRWSKIKDGTVTGEFIFVSTAPGYNADNADSLGFNTDTCPYGPDDPFWVSNQPILSFFDTNHEMNTFNGGNLAATLQTSEKQIIPGKRANVKTCRPVVDGGSPTVTPITRNRIEDTTVTGSAASLNSDGYAPLRTNAFYHRFQVNIPSSTSFTHAQGVEIPDDKISTGGVR